MTGQLGRHLEDLSLSQKLLLILLVPVLALAWFAGMEVSRTSLNRNQANYVLELQELTASVSRAIRRLQLERAAVAGFLRDPAAVPQILNSSFQSTEGALVALRESLGAIETEYRNAELLLVSEKASAAMERLADTRGRILSRRIGAEEIGGAYGELIHPLLDIGRYLPDLEGGTELSGALMAYSGLLKIIEVASREIGEGRVHFERGFSGRLGLERLVGLQDQGTSLLDDALLFMTIPQQELFARAMRSAGVFDAESLRTSVAKAYRRARIFDEFIWIVEYEGEAPLRKTRDYPADPGVAKELSERYLAMLRLLDEYQRSFSLSSEERADVEAFTAQLSLYQARIALVTGAEESSDSKIEALIGLVNDESGELLASARRFVGDSLRIEPLLWVDATVARRDAMLGVAEQMSASLQDRIVAIRKQAEVDSIVAVGIALVSLIIAIGLGIVLRNSIIRQLGADPVDLRKFSAEIGCGNLGTDKGHGADVDPPSRSVYADMRAMQRKLRELVAGDRQTLAEYTRIKEALDQTMTNVMITDTNFKIIYMNASVVSMLRKATDEIRKDLPDFDVDRLLGSCMDQFHQKASVQRARLMALKESFTANIKLGGKRFQLILNSIIDESGERIGTVLEWADMTEKLRREAEREQRTKRIEKMLDVLGSLRISINREGKILASNEPALRYFGYEARQLDDLSLSKILGQDMTVDTVLSLSVNGVFQGMRCLATLADGRLLPVRVFGLVLYNEGPASDVREIVLLVQPEDGVASPGTGFNLAEELVERLSDGVALINTEWSVLSVNRAFSDILGLDPDAAMGSSLPDLLPDFPLPDSGENLETEYFGRRADGTEYVALIRLHLLGPGDSRRRNVLLTLKDITRLKESEEHIRKLAYKDPLTQLSNRVYFQQRVEDAIKIARRRQQRLALLYFDLDGFKDINDSLGHQAGDELLQIIAARIKSILRESDFAARLGGDEFCVLLEDVKDGYGAAAVADKSLQLIAEPILICGRELQPRASIGITLFPDDGTDYDSLLRTADSAMYAAKQSGKDRYAFYTPDLTVAAEQRMTLEHDLRRSVQAGEFEVFYQPQVSLDTGMLVSVESLVRWRHPQRGLLAPSEFISVAERIGLIQDLGDTVLRLACKQAIIWSRELANPICVAVNISGLHFQDGLIVDSVSTALRETGLDPGLLEIEVTESVLQTSDETIDTFLRLRALGVRIAIDDFGTGYSCLDAIRRLPIDTLKIDQRFIKDLLLNPESPAIVATIIAMTQAMRIRVVSEGVETLEQVQYLSALGCNLVQGYFFSRPVPADKIIGLAAHSFLPEQQAGQIVA